jgi:hypothetical protein
VGEGVGNTEKTALKNIKRLRSAKW